MGSDPDDRNVFWAAQTVMTNALNKAQIPVQLLQGQGSGPEAHILSNSSRVVADWCARQMGTDEIVGRAAKGLKG